MIRPAEFAIRQQVKEPDICKKNRTFSGLTFLNVKHIPFSEAGHEKKQSRT